MLLPTISSPLGPGECAKEQVQPKSRLHRPADGSQLLALFGARATRERNIFRCEKYGQNATQRQRASVLGEEDSGWAKSKMADHFNCWHRRIVIYYVLRDRIPASPARVSRDARCPRDLSVVLTPHFKLPPQRGQERFGKYSGSQEKQETGDRGGWGEGGHEAAEGWGKTERTWLVSQWPCTVCVFGQSMVKVWTPYTKYSMPPDGSTGMSPLTFVQPWRSQK